MASHNDDSGPSRTEIEDGESRIAARCYGDPSLTAECALSQLLNLIEAESGQTVEAEAGQTDQKVTLQLSSTTYQVDEKGRSLLTDFIKEADETLSAWSALNREIMGYCCNQISVADLRRRKGSSRQK